MNILYFEFPSFGLGPASTSCHLIKAVQKKFNCQIVVISSGVALDFARVSLKNVTFVDFDTNYTTSFHELKSRISENAMIVTNTNIDFCRWCTQQNYSIISIDTLFWMWEQDLEFIPNTVAYIVQDYFVQERQFNSNYKKYKDKLQVVKPIVRREELLRKSGEPPKNQALISLGGMETPFNRDIIFMYCDFVLPELIRQLTENGIEKIHLVGGLIKPYANYANWLFKSRNIEVHGMVSQDQYVSLLSCSYHFIAPGLTTIYESYVIDTPPYLLPGFSMSQILQAESFRKMTNYPYVAQWQDVSDIVRKLSDMGEDEGTAYFNQFIKACIQNEPQFQFNGVDKYINEKHISTSELMLGVKSIQNRWQQLEDAADVLINTLMASNYTRKE